jgi:rRNA maturation RNase YbeY
MITIRDTQRKIKVNLDQLKKDAQKILDMLDYSDFDLGIWLTTNKTIRAYNKEYRHKDKATNILSFPFHPKLKAGERIKVKTPDDKNLGDLILSLEYVKKEAENLSLPLQKHLLRLLVHGICHLLGYDHIKDADYAIMHKKEQELLEHFNIKIAY